MRVLKEGGGGGEESQNFCHAARTNLSPLGAQTIMLLVTKWSPIFYCLGAWGPHFFWPPALLQNPEHGKTCFVCFKAIEIINHVLLQLRSYAH